MAHRTLILAVSAALTMGFLASDAEATHRKRMFYGYGYYPGPDYNPPPPPRYYRYYDGRQEYLVYEDGYDPYYDPPVRKVKKKKKIAKNPGLKKKSVKSQAAAPKKTTKSVAAVEQTEPTNLPVAKKDPVKAAAKSTAAPQSTAAVSCEKAGTILTGYGFSDIKPTVCTGKEYAFAAARDGKTYAIKLNSANGELTEVRKVR